MRWISFAAGGLAVLVSATAEASCPVFDVAMDEAATAVRGFRFAVADEALAEALIAVGCAEVDDPKRLGRLLRVHGARRYFDGDLPGAERYFAAARALDRETFESETWGEEALAVWWKANANGYGHGTLAILVPDGAPIVVDGQPGRNADRVTAIPHVVRVSTVAARLADVQPEATTVVDLSTVELPPPPEPVIEAVVEVVEVPVVVPPPVVPVDPPERTHRRGFHAGISIGAPTAMRFEGVLGGRVVDAIGVRAGASPLVYYADVIVGGGPYVDFRLGGRARLQLGGWYGQDLYGVMLPGGWFTIQYDPPSAFQLDVGAGGGMVMTEDGDYPVAWPELATTWLF